MEAHTCAHSGLQAVLWQLLSHLLPEAQFCSLLAVQSKVAGCWLLQSWLHCAWSRSKGTAGIGMLRVVWGLDLLPAYLLTDHISPSLPPQSPWSTRGLTGFMTVQTPENCPDIISSFPRLNYLPSLHLKFCGPPRYLKAVLSTLVAGYPGRGGAAKERLWTF